MISNEPLLPSEEETEVSKEDISMEQAKEFTTEGIVMEKDMEVAIQDKDIVKSAIEADYRKDFLEASAGTIISKTQLESLNIQDFFYQQEISDSLFQRIYGKSYKENCTVPSESLTYIRVLHYGFDGETHIGEMICNKNISQDLIDIFSQLYDNQYPIEKMVLIDDYDADDERSMADNNSSAFNFRNISGTANLSKHSMGYAVDINPLYNPYVRTIDGQQVCEPAGGIEYVDRTKDFSYGIDKDDLCCQLFIQYGFTWGGDWESVKDYQHFEKVVE